jgi:hypothetical protein
MAFKVRTEGLTLTQKLQDSFNQNYASGLVVQREDGCANLSEYSPEYSGGESPLEAFIKESGCSCSKYSEKNADILIGKGGGLSPLTQKGWEFLCSVWDAGRLEVNSQNYGEYSNQRLAGRYVAPFGVVDNREFELRSDRHKRMPCPIQRGHCMD